MANPNYLTIFSLLTISLISLNIELTSSQTYHTGPHIVTSPNRVWRVIRRPVPTTTTSTVIRRPMVVSTPVIPPGSSSLANNNHPNGNNYMSNNNLDNSQPNLMTPLGSLLSQPAGSLLSLLGLAPPNRYLRPAYDSRPTNPTGAYDTNDNNNYNEYPSYRYTSNTDSNQAAPLTRGTSQPSRYVTHPTPTYYNTNSDTSNRYSVGSADSSATYRTRPVTGNHANSMSSGASASSSNAAPEVVSEPTTARPDLGFEQ